MNRSVIILAMILSSVSRAQAPTDGTLIGTLTPEQAQARQFGIFMGGTASEYDLCVNKGFISRADPSAEVMAKAFLDNTWSLNRGPNESAYVQEGWDMMKKEVLDHDSFYTKEKCVAVAKEWAKIVATMHKK